MMTATIAADTKAAITELLAAASLVPGQILVIGCSTSEIQGQAIGTTGSRDTAQSVLSALLAVTAPAGIAVAIQCCEHLNRALVVERSTWERYRLDEVSVVPQPQAGGSLAAQAMQVFNDPVVVETIQAHAGLDIGLTLIGMHLKRVAVPVRLAQTRIGQAVLSAARTRPPLIGGARAQYRSE